MRTISVTEAKKGLTQLAAEGQSFNLTSRGHELASFRVFVQPKFDPVKAKASWEAFKAIRSAKPSKKDGGTRAIRELRDGVDE